MALAAFRSKGLPFYNLAASTVIIVVLELDSSVEHGLNMVVDRIGAGGGDGCILVLVFQEYPAVLDMCGSRE